jgi:hypothetical protein
MSNSGEMSLLKAGPRHAEHPVDITLDELRGAIAHAVGEEVELGIGRGDDNVDEDATGAVLGGPRFIAYGEQGSGRFYEYRINNDTLETANPAWTQYNDRINEQRAANTLVDPRRFSRTLFVNSEAKKAGEFTASSVERIINVPAAAIMQSGIGLADVSASQARRMVLAMRDAYSAGEWRQTMQMGLAAKHIWSFIDRAKRVAYDSPDRSLVSIADSHIPAVLNEEEYRTDVDLLVARSLKRGIAALRYEGRSVAANHGEKWLSMLEEGMTLDVFTPETTIEDVLRYPSFLNPRPDRGVPRMWNSSYLMGGSGSRNHLIEYPDGARYRVDYPYYNTGGARPIRGREEAGYVEQQADYDDRGRELEDGEGRWLDFTEMARNSLARHMTDEAMQESVSFRELGDSYGDILQQAKRLVAESKYADIEEEERLNVETRLAALFSAAHCMRLAKTQMGVAREYHEYTMRSWGSKWDIEEETGISLSWRWKGIDNLSKEMSEAYAEFGSHLRGFEMARLAEVNRNHPELTEHIRHYRELHDMQESQEFYWAGMVAVGERLMGGSGPVAALASERFNAVSNDAKPDAGGNAEIVNQ